MASSGSCELLPSGIGLKGIEIIAASDAVVAGKTAAKTMRHECLRFGPTATGIDWKHITGKGVAHNMLRKILQAWPSNCQPLSVGWGDDTILCAK